MGAQQKKNINKKKKTLKKITVPLSQQEPT